jgi:hypothetical protein
VKRVLTFLLALVVATAGAVGILLALQSRDEGSLGTTTPPPTVRTTVP